MTSPRFDATVSLGNVLVVVTLLVTAVAAWVANRERTFSNRAAIAELQADVADLEIRVRQLEIVGLK